MSPRNHTTCGSSRGANVIGCSRSAGPPALGNFAGLKERVRDMLGEFAAAKGNPEAGRNIGAADGVELGSFSIEHPALHDQVRKAFGVIVVHMREEDCIELHRIDAKL